MTQDIQKQGYFDDDSTIIPNKPSIPMNYVPPFYTKTEPKKQKRLKVVLLSLIFIQVLAILVIVLLGNKGTSLNAKTSLKSQVSSMPSVQEDGEDVRKKAFEELKKCITLAGKTSKYTDEDGFECKRVGTKYYLYDITDDGIPELWIEYDKYMNLPDGYITKAYNDYTYSDSDDFEFEEGCDGHEGCDDEEDFFEMENDICGEEECTDGDDYDYMEKEYIETTYSYQSSGTILDCYMYNPSKNKLERILNRRNMGQPSFLGNKVYTFGEGYYDMLTYDHRNNKILVSKYNDSDLPKDAIRMNDYDIHDLKPLNKKI